MQAVLILFISAKFTKQWWKAKKKGADIRGAA
jgi:simple sugar transport system permease protein